MTKEALIQRTIKQLQQLPKEQVDIIADYTEFIYKKLEESILQRGIEQIVSESKSFYFLKDEEDLYDIKDLKERFK